VIDLLASVFKQKYPDITSLNVNALNAVCDYLQIPFKYEIFSTMGVDFSNLVKAPGDWALHISKYYQASEYINPYGGEEIFDKAQYKEARIEIKFLKNNLLSYNQHREKFEPGLSIIDVMMFNSPAEVSGLIDSYELN
jgi:hypothetical protein